MRKLLLLLLCNAAARIKTAELNQAAVIDPATGLPVRVSGVDREFTQPFIAHFKMQIA